MFCNFTPRAGVVFALLLLAGTMALAQPRLRDLPPTPAEVPQLVAVLAGGDAASRGEAAARLGLIVDERAAGPLVRALTDPETEVRQAAVSSLKYYRDPRAVAPLLAMVKDDKTGQALRMSICETLAMQRDSRIPPALIPLLADAQADVRKVAGTALIGYHDPRLLEPFLGLLGGEEWGIGYQGLLMLGGPVADRMAALQGDPRPSVRWVALAILGALADPRGKDAALQALGDEDSIIRNQAIWAVAMYGDPRAVPPLIAMLQAPENGTRERAVRTLGELRDPRAVEPLLALLADKNESLRSQVVQALGELRDPRAVELLLALLADNNESLHSQVVRALCAIGDPRALGPLMLDEAAASGYQLIHMLNAFPDEAVIETLLASLAAPNDALREYALMATANYAQHGVPPPALTEGLIALLGHQAPAVRNAAVRLLGDAGDGAAVAPLREMLKDGDAGVRAQVVQALYWEETREDHAALVAAVQDTAAPVRIAAVRGIAAQQDEALLPHLLTATRDGDVEVRKAARAALRRWRQSGAMSPTALDALAQWAAGEPDPQAALASLTGVRTPREKAQMYAALASAEPQERMNAIIGLLPTDAADPRVEKAIIALIEQGTGREVEEFLSRPKAATAPRLPYLTDALLARLDRPGHDLIAQGAIMVELGTLGDPCAVPALTAIARGRQGEAGRMRDSAMRALAQIGGPGMDALLPMASLQDMASLEAVIDALPASTDPRGVDLLLGICASNEFIKRDWGLESLARAMEKAPDARAVDLFLDALQDHNRRLRQVSAIALGRIGDPRAVPALLNLLGDADYQTRETAIRVIGKIGDARAVAPLAALAQTGTSRDRYLALIALAGMGDGKALDVVLPALRGAALPVRRGIVDALRTNPAPRAREALQALATTDPAPSVRQTAKSALARGAK